MKANRIEKGRHRGIAVVIALALVAGAVIGGKIGYDRLRAIYLEQCVIRDMSAQVDISSSGKMVRPGTIAEVFGLKVGRNLAEIDFTRRRAEVLKSIPNLKSIRIVRHLPDKVTIVAEERTPIARMGVRGDRKTTGRVVDTEGVVFLCQRGTQTLPVIFEPRQPGTMPGQTIQNRTRAALRLIETCRAPQFLELGILEVDTSKHDFLLVTLGNYSRLKILWEEMDEDTARAREDLAHRLDRVVMAIRQQATPSAVIWNATIPDRVFADSQEKL